MKIYRDYPIRHFEFWAGAKDTVDYLTHDELDTIEECLEGAFPEGMSAGELNDFVWHERDFIAELLGYESFDELMDSRRES